MHRVTNGFLWTVGIGAALVALVRPSRGLGPQPQATEVEEGPGSGGPQQLPPGGVVSADAGRLTQLTRSALEQTEPHRSYLQRLGAEIREDNVTLIAGSMSFYGMLALFPAMIAAVSIYGLAFDPDDLTDQFERIAELLPELAARIITEQLVEVTEASSTGLRFGVVVAILISLYTASAGVRALIKGLNVAYDTSENRSLATVRALAYAITFGAIVAAVGAMTIIVFLPVWLDSIGFGGGGALAELIALPLAFVLAVAGLNVLYRIAPSRHPRYSRWATAGSLVAAAGWILATTGLSIYLTRVGNLNATYGTLTGVIVLLLWFFLSGFAVLVGAEVNALSEQRRKAADDAP